MLLLLHCTTAYSLCASSRNNAFAVTMIAALFGIQHTVYVLPAETTPLL
jgi:hypothetical protein